MSTVKLFCPRKDLTEVMAYMMKSDVKYYPVRRYFSWDRNFGYGGYRLEMDAGHSIVPFLILKFDLKTLSDEHV